MTDMPGFSTFNPAIQTPQGQPPLGPTSATLDGNWRGQSGEVLVVRNGLFRIYLDRDRYQEGRIELRGKDVLGMQSQDGSVTRRYEYAVHEGRLVLRDEAGNLLLYKRIP